MNSIEQNFSRLSLLLNQLGEILQKTHAIAAHVSQIPPVISTQEHEEIMLITPENKKGKDALKLAAKAYQDLHIKEGYSKKSARRYVGVIQLNPNQLQTPLIITLVDEINVLKTAIANYIIENYHDRNSRFEAIHRACPGVMTLHLYRHIHLIKEQTVKSLSFSWQRKQAIHQPNKLALVKTLSNDVTTASEMQREQILQLINAIEQCPEKALRVRRAVKVQPSANLKVQGKTLTLTAPLPIIVVQSETIKIKEIGDFDAKKQRKKRADSQKRKTLGMWRGNSYEQIL